LFISLCNGSTFSEPTGSLAFCSCWHVV
jgi:hypothetical protein